MYIKTIIIIIPYIIIHSTKKPTYVKISQITRSVVKVGPATAFYFVNLASIAVFLGLFKKRGSCRISPLKLFKMD